MLKFCYKGGAPIDVDNLPTGPVNGTTEVEVPLSQFPGIKIEEIKAKVNENGLVGYLWWLWYHFYARLFVSDNYACLLISGVPLTQKAFQHLTFWVGVDLLKGTVAGDLWLAKQMLLESGERVGKFEAMLRKVLPSLSETLQKEVNELLEPKKENA